MAQTEYTLVFQETCVDVDECEHCIPPYVVFPKAMKADSPVLRYLRPTQKYKPLVHELSNPNHMANFLYSTMSTLQVAAVLEIIRAYSEAVMDVELIPRGTAVVFTRENLYTRELHEGDLCDFAPMIAGRTDDQLMDIMRDLGCSKMTESILEECGEYSRCARFVYSADEMSRIKSDVAAYELARKTGAFVHPDEVRIIMAVK